MPLVPVALAELLGVDAPIVFPVLAAVAEGPTIAPPPPLDVAPPLPVAVVLPEPLPDIADAEDPDDIVVLLMVEFAAAVMFPLADEFCA